MAIFPVLLIVATLLCALVSGFLFAFAVVVMPGIRALRDAEFLRAFQAMDRVIQDRQPIFMAVWIGSVLALLAAAVVGVRSLDGTARLALLAATAVWLLGVQLPTMAVNIPLNNRIQSLVIDEMTEADCSTARRQFESRWNRANVIRTLLACAVSLLLLVLLSTFQAAAA